MDTRQMFIYIVILLAVVGLTIWFTRSNCQSLQGMDNPMTKCLMNCDKLCDSMYTNCDSKDEQCIGRCYQQKAQCYIKCMEQK